MEGESKVDGEGTTVAFAFLHFPVATEAVNRPYSQNSADDRDDGGTQIRR